MSSQAFLLFALLFACLTAGDEYAEFVKHVQWFHHHEHADWILTRGEYQCHHGYGEDRVLAHGFEHDIVHHPHTGQQEHDCRPLKHRSKAQEKKDHTAYVLVGPELLQEDVSY